MPTTVTVISAEPHPDADKLKIYQVVWRDADGDHQAQIIANLTNVYEVYDQVTMIRPGETYEGIEVQPRNVRGIRSEGMLVGKISHELS